MKTFFNLALVTTLAFAATACGNKSSKKTPAQLEDQQPVVTEVPVKMTFRGTNFPSKVIVTINGETVVDECFAKSPLEFDRSAEPTILVPSVRMSTVSEASVKVTDCAGVEFMPSTNAVYTVESNVVVFDL